jgi:hypothetical protein
VAPAEIASQVHTLVALTSDLQETIETARTDQALAVEQTLRAHAADVEAVTAAGREVTDFARKNCGIELDTTAVPTSTLEADGP